MSLTQAPLQHAASEINLYHCQGYMSTHQMIRPLLPASYQVLRHQCLRLAPLSSKWAMTLPVTHQSAHFSHRIFPHKWLSFVLKVCKSQPERKLPTIASERKIQPVRSFPRARTLYVMFLRQEQQCNLDTRTYCSYLEKLA